MASNVIAVISNIEPGDTVLTRMPYGTNSSAQRSVLKISAICVVDETGRIMKELRAASEPDPPVAALQRTGLPLERIGLETCSLTAWLYEGLRHAGLPAICIEARQANAAMKTMPNKADRNDARALAQILRTGSAAGTSSD